MVLAGVRKLLSADTQPVYLGGSDAREGGGRGISALEMADTGRSAEAMEPVVDHEALRPPYIHVTDPPNGIVLPGTNERMRRRCWPVGLEARRAIC